MSLPPGLYQIISVSSHYPQPREDPSVAITNEINNPVSVDSLGAPGIQPRAIWLLEPGPNGLYLISNRDNTLFWGTPGDRAQPKDEVVLKDRPTPWKVQCEPVDGGYLADIRPGADAPPGADVHVGLEHRKLLQIHDVPQDYAGDKAKWLLRRIPG